MVFPRKANKKGACSSTRLRVSSGPLAGLAQLSNATVSTPCAAKCCAIAGAISLSF